MSRYRCEVEDTSAPRVGCACRECYRTREMNLDARLLDLVSERMTDNRLFPTIRPSREIAHRALTAYLAGRLDYGALHTTIIHGLMELADNQFAQILLRANLQSGQFIVREPEKQ